MQNMLAQVSTEATQILKGVKSLGYVHILMRVTTEKNELAL